MIPIPLKPLNLKGKADEAKIQSEMMLFRRCILLLKGSTVKKRPVRENGNGRQIAFYLAYSTIRGTDVRS